jgi:hypothetical protein
MGDNAAVLEGYTKEVVATCAEHELYLLIKPGTDLDSAFKAWDTDEQEFIRVNGWLYVIMADRSEYSYTAHSGRDDEGMI